MDELQYVYKYVNNASIVVYVGITNNMKKRVLQHKRDKLKDVKNPVIYYFPVKYRADADILETYLISHYKTGRFFNVSKTQKGDVSFMDICDMLPWNRFMGEVDKTAKPFVMSSITNMMEKIIEKPVLINSETIDGQIRKIDNFVNEMLISFDNLISFEGNVVNGLNALLKKKNNSVVRVGLYLHKKRLIWAKVAKRHIFTMPFNEEKQDRLISMGTKIKNDIDEYERSIK